MTVSAEQRGVSLSRSYWNFPYYVKLKAAYKATITDMKSSYFKFNVIYFTEHTFYSFENIKSF